MRTKAYFFFCLSILLFFTFSSKGQFLSDFNGKGFSGQSAYPGSYSDDTGKAKINRKARNTAIKSAIVPGLGQVQNNQIWKVPVVWAGLGLTTYFYFDNQQKYQKYAKAFRLRTDGDPNTVDQFDPQSDNSPVFSQQGLKDARETFRRYRTISLFSIVGVYGLNILDAYVFAHLKDFDISDDLSLSVNPPKFGNIARPKSVMTGITVKIKP